MINTHIKIFIFFTINVFLLVSNQNTLVAETITLTVSKPEVFKRNKGSCKRLGNIYDACHWMARFVVTNKGNKKITNFCTIMKVEKKTFELCYGNSKKMTISSNAKKTFLINLTDLMQISIDTERPTVRIKSIQ